MKTASYFYGKLMIILLALVISNSAAEAQISMIGANPNSATAFIDIVQWDPMEPGQEVYTQSLLQSYLMASSLFDAYNSKYYLSGNGELESGLFSFNTLTSEQTIQNYNSFTNITEIDMSTSKVYTLDMDPVNQIYVSEYDLNTGTSTIIGQLNEPGMQGLVVDATGFDSNHGIIYYVGYDGNEQLCLFSIPVREAVFSYTKMPLAYSSGVYYLNSLNYDNVNDKLFGMLRLFNGSNYVASYVAEINTLTSEVSFRGELVGYDSFVMGASAFDQITGTFMQVGLDADNNYDLLMFNTSDNSLQIGYVPEGVSEIVCDNYEYSRSAYQVTSMKADDPAEFRVYPNPAGDYVVIDQIHDQNSRISLTDISGKKIREYNSVSKGAVRLDLTGIDSGLYLMTIHNGPGSSTRVLSVVKK